LKHRLASVVIALLLAPPVGAQAQLEIALAGGMSAGGRLFRVVSPDAGDPFGGSYTTPDGRELRAAEFDTELEETVAFSLRFRKLLRPQWYVSAAVAGTDMDISANRRTVSDNVDIVPYDQVFVFAMDTSVEFDWIPRGSRPFVSFGLGMVNLNFQERVAGDSLDQFKFALCAGAGFRWRRFALADVDIEARVARVAPDFGPEERRLTAAESFDGEGAIHLWQLNVAWVYAF
jgi:hypothetical protein